MIRKGKKIVDFTIIKFVIVGVINTLFGTILMFTAYNLLNFNYWISSALNYIMGSVLSYFLNKYFTFKNHTKGWRPVIRFVINILICYLIAYGIAKPVVSWLLRDLGQKMQDNGAMLLGMILFTGLNYFGQRFYAFKE